MTKPTLPRVYTQMKKLKEFWMKSNSSEKQVYIAALTESMREVYEQYEIDLELYLELTEVA